MAFTAKYRVGSTDYSMQNFHSIHFEKSLNGVATFQVDIPSATPHQRANIVGDTEIKITLGNHSLNGYAKEVSKSESNNGLTVGGTGYLVALGDTYADTADAYPNMDASSSGRIVLWVNKKGGVVVQDLLTNTPIGVGTINTSTGNARNFRFDNMKKLDIIKQLAKYVDTELEGTNSKTLNWGDRQGSATSVKTYRWKQNCFVIDQKNSAAVGKVWKVVILGRGTGTSQIVGTALASGYSRIDPTKNKEKIYVNNNITDTDVATDYAAATLSQLEAEYANFVINASNPEDNVQLGDRVTFYDESGVPHDMRVGRLKKRLTGDQFRLTLELIAEGNKTLRARLDALVEQFGQLIEVHGSSSQEKLIIVGPKSENSSDSKKLRLVIPIPADAKTIISAKLNFSRQSLKFDTTNTTGDGTQNTYDFGHDLHPVGTYSDIGHTHFVAGLTLPGRPVSSYPAQYYSENLGSSSTSSGWIIVCAGNAGDGSAMGYEEVEAYLNVYYNGTGSPIGRVRLRDAYGYYYPNVTGVPIYFREGATTTVDGHFHLTGSFGSTYLRWLADIDGWGVSRWPRGQVWLEFATGNSVTKHFGGYIISKKKHLHIFSDTSSAQTGYAALGGGSGNKSANIVNPAHVNPITQTVDSPGSEPSYTVGYAFNGGGETPVGGVSVGYTSAEIDVTSSIDLGTANNYLEIRPTGSGNLARLTAQVKLTYL